MNEKRSRHHRRPVSLGGSDSKRNVSNVSVKQHQSWHNIFGNRRPEDIAALINAVWLDPSYQFVCIDRKQFRDDRRQLKLDLYG
jgi:hypothetical protein